ncbi:MAG: hypothetical protein H6667_25520 [Ardenticatenaceae bacterium]|nr:hypothetical protein [Ardenticatenaceae bacterium]
MPNYCNNQLEITGSAADIARFKNLVRGEDTALSLDTLVKMPSFLKLIQPGGILPNWYDWSVKHWGTKWDVTEVTLVNKSDECLVYHFLSAWNPPEAWLIRAAQTFPNLQFQLTYIVEGEDGEHSLVLD